MKRCTAVILGMMIIASVASIGVLTAVIEAQASDVYKLKLTTYHGKTYWAWPIYEAFAKTVKERSGGKLQIDLFGDQSLAKHSATVSSVQGGLADMGFVAASYIPGAFKLEQVWDLPPLHSTAVEGTEWYKQLFDEFFKKNIIQLELHQLGVFVTPPYSLFTATQRIERIEDLQGLKIKTSGAAATKMAGLLGAIPITLGAAESYEALQKGNIVGAFTAMATAVSYKWYEVGKPGYVSAMGGLPGTSCFLLMNKKVYDGLPRDLQKVLDDAAWEEWSLPFATGLDNEEKAGLQTMENKGVKVVVWSDEELRRVAAIKDQMWSEWVKEMDGKGMPGSKLEKAIRALHAKN